MTLTSTTFAGDKKVGRSMLHEAEVRMVRWGTPLWPAWIEGWHLTLTSLLWGAGNVWFGWLARGDVRWLWGVSAMIVLQYVSDCFDGALGRHRDKGLVKWGYYMDHFMDFLFLGSLVIAGWLIAPPDMGGWFILLFLLTGATMVSTFLSFAATNRFEIYISGFGPTEMRIGIIAINTFLIFAGTTHFRWTVPLLCGLCSLGLVFVVVRTSNQLWAMDMEEKARRLAQPQA